MAGIRSFALRSRIRRGDRRRDAARERGAAPVAQPLRISSIMGSQSDWRTMKHAADTLEELGVAYETRVISAHRTPDLMFAYAEQAAGRPNEFVNA